jgi:23S rRNA (cytidine1920-2'-O)/16S rRNA (cytidine1409-2'-O)-methyltransferase
MVGKESNTHSAYKGHVKIEVMAKKKRVDQILVDRGLVDDLDTARRLIMAGKVRVQGQIVMKPSRTISDQVEIVVIPESPFVSRGGQKLQAAFDHFPINVSDLICADIGASTGGFTDCLLKQGASRVYAVDVGYGILDWRLRNDPRVVVMERTNARTLSEFPEAVDFVTADVSFISLTKILPNLRKWFNKQGGEAIFLIKPQFEATRQEADEGAGVILNPEIHQRILIEVLSSANTLGFQVKGLMQSPLFGPDGNKEFLLWLGFPGKKTSNKKIKSLVSALFDTK